MDQTHIGYTFWNEPPANNIPKLTRIELQEKSLMGLAVDGSDLHWPDTAIQATLPQFDVYLNQHYFVDVFNRGNTPFTVQAISSVPWIRLSRVPRENNPPEESLDQHRLVASATRVARWHSGI